MIYKPHDYQRAATERIIAAPKVALFLGVGLGKTVITLTAIKELKRRKEAYKTLVIAPLNVAKNTWATEASKWRHTQNMAISKVLGTAKQRIKALTAKADFYVINRENVPWLVDYYGDKWPFDMVVIDELSSFKSNKSQRFKKMKEVLPKIKRIVGLTATPTPNGLQDLWPQIYLLDEGERLGKYITHYMKKYFIPVKYSGGMVFRWKIKEGSEAAIQAQIADICVSMSAEDYLTLPPRIDRFVDVELPTSAQRQYRQLGKEYLLSFAQSDVVADSAAVLAGKLLQLANGAVYDENHAVQEIHTAKLQALGDIAEAANGNPLLVFYLFKHDKARITAHLATMGLPVVALRTEQSVTDWNRGSIPILLAHPASAGHGLNLQAGGHTVVWYGLPWSLELYEQGNGRLHRQGQQQPVVVHHLIAKNTIDEDVMYALQSKHKSQAALLNAVKARLCAPDVVGAIAV